MDASLIQILIGAGSTIIAAAIASVLSLLAVRTQERRLRAATETDNAQKVSDAAVKLLEPYEEQLTKLQSRIEAQDKLIEYLRCDLETERDRRKELEELVKNKDNRIATMQIELDRIPGMQAEIDKLKKQLARMPK